MDKVHSVQELIERTKDMPLDKMRFFINQDKKEPCCFGIYQDGYTGHWVVYKNKDNGSRAVRYSGPDEAYAAQELWAKIQSEIALRRAKQPRQLTRGEIIRNRVRKIAIVVIIAILAFMAMRWIARRPNRGYYRIDNDLYYYQDSAWYYYDDGNWEHYYGDTDYDWYNGNYYGRTYYGFSDSSDAFENSNYYVEPSSDSSDSSSSYSSSYSSSDDSSVFDSWDSSDTDWDSDW